MPNWKLNILLFQDGRRLNPHGKLLMRYGSQEIASPIFWDLGRENKELKMLNSLILPHYQTNSAWESSNHLLSKIAELTSMMRRNKVNVTYLDLPACSRRRRRDSDFQMTSSCHLTASAALYWTEDPVNINWSLLLDSGSSCHPHEELVFREIECSPLLFSSHLAIPPLSLFRIPCYLVHQLVVSSLTGPSCSGTNCKRWSQKLVHVASVRRLSLLFFACLVFRFPVQIYSQVFAAASGLVSNAA